MATRKFRRLIALATAGVSAPALPALGSLIADWDAATIAQGDGSAVASWTDSISGIVAAQGTGANQPSYKTNSLGTAPAVVFGGTHWMPIATPGVLNTAVVSQNYTVLFVIDNVLSTTNGSVFGAGAGGNSWHFAANSGFIGRFNGNYLKCAVPATGSAAPATFTTFGASASTAYPFGTAAVRERIWVRGMTVHHQPGVPPAPAAGYAFGSLSSVGTASFNFKGRLYRALVWNKELSLIEMIQAEVYLCTKYGQPLPWAGTTAFAVFDSDSQGAAVGGSGPAACWPYISATNAGLTYGQFMNLSVGGITKPQLITKAAELQGIPAAVGKRMIYVPFEYYNDRAHTGAVNYADMQTLLSTVKGGTNSGKDIKSVVCSSISSGADPDANRASYDSLLDATPPGDQYAAFHTDATMGVSGAAAAGFPTYFNSDASAFIHPTDAGYALMAPYVTPKITAAIAMA